MVNFVYTMLCCGARWIARMCKGFQRIIRSGTFEKWDLKTTAIFFIPVIGVAAYCVIPMWVTMMRTTHSNNTTTSSTTPTVTIPRSDRGNGPLGYDDLRKDLYHSFKCRGNPGMVIVAIKNGKKVLSESYGVTLPGSGVSVTQDTRFMISSLTKGFTAALLVDVFANNTRNQSYDLATPLRDILGDDFSFADDERTKYGSAEDILSHRIGLPNKGFMRFNPSFNRSDFLYFPRYWKTDLPFRGTAKYSSVTYTLAAAITEKLGGKTWEELAKERLFEPLGMTKTGFASTTNFSDSDVAKAYSMFTANRGPIDSSFTRVWNSRCGSGCVVSTADDMVKWMKFMLTDGHNDMGDRVFAEDQFETLTKIRTYLRSSRRDVITKPEFPVTSVADDYALAWRNGFYRGHRVLSHSGTSPGFAAMMMLYPDNDLGIFVAMNGKDGNYHYRLALTHYISDYLLGRTPWLNASTLCSFPKPWKAPIIRPKYEYDIALTPALPYRQYTGTYSSPMYGELVVNFNQSTSSLQGLYGIGSWKLIPEKKTNIFFGRGIRVTDFWNMSGWQFVAADDNPNNITKLRVHGFDVDDPPVFEKVTH